MDLYSNLLAIKGLNNNAMLRVVCTDNIIVEGKYYGFTQALDNEPEIAQLDILSKDGKVIGLYETEILKIIKVEAR